MSGGALYLGEAELIADLGELCTRALLGAFGGQTLYVPAHPRADNPIAQAIGSDNAEKLAGMVRSGNGSLWIELPVGSHGVRSRWRQRLAEMAADPSLSTQHIASVLRISSPSVTRARARLKAKAA